MEVGEDMGRSPCFMSASAGAGSEWNGTFNGSFSSGGGEGGKQSSQVSMRFDSRIASSPAWTALCHRHVCTQRYLIQDSQTILHILVLLVSSQSSPLIRARCMKALGQLVRTDSSLLHLPRMEELVLERFNDVSISVREETVKLVGKYLLSLRSASCAIKQKTILSKGEGLERESSESAASSGGCGSEDRYLNGLLVRLRDKGVSVRKSVAHTVREILLHQPEHPRYTELCR